MKNYGGTETVKLTTDQMPSHNHRLVIHAGGNHSHGNYVRNTRDNRAPKGPLLNTRYQGIGQGPKLIGNAGNHGHGFDIYSTGNSQSHENMPPYCVLLYIIKL